MKKVIAVFGTRPEAIKMCPVILELKRSNTFKTLTVVTSQHKELLFGVLERFGIKPDYDLGLMKESQTPSELSANVILGMEKIFKEEAPELVLVHGDTSTAFAAAVAAYLQKIKIGHIEAGLRTYNLYRPFPEEFNRRVIDIISDYDFAPTFGAMQNLTHEGKARERIYITGNTAVDALKYTLDPERIPKVAEGTEGMRIILLTLHRRESLGEPMKNALIAIARVIAETPDTVCIYSVHPNPESKRVARDVMSNAERVRMTSPLNTVEFHNLMAMSYLILTDSGGIQEEAPSLGVPTLVLRDITERPEGIEAGCAVTIGTDGERVYKEFKKILSDKELYQKMKSSKNPYGDGQASRRIKEIIEKLLSKREEE